MVEIQNFLINKQTWRQIGAYYELDHTWVFRWYKKQLKNREVKTEEIINKLATIKTTGTTPPPGYISPRSNSDWVDYYAMSVYVPEEEIWTADYLTEMREVFWNKKNILLLEPRGHGKSFSVAALVCRYILEVRDPVIVVTSQPNKEKIYSQVYAILTSERVQSDYGDEFIVGAARNSGYIRLDERFGVHRDPHFQVVGRDTGIVGGHQGLIVLEDVIQEEYVSPQSNERLMDWFKSTVRFMKRRHTQIWVVGTRKGPTDFYYFVKNKMRFPEIKKQALVLKSGRFPLVEELTWNEDGECIDYPRGMGEYEILGCPEWPIERLLGEYCIDPESFESEMNNNPIPLSGLYFEKDHWTETDYYNEIPHLHRDWVFYMAVDPATGQSQSSDNTSMVVVGIYAKKMYIMDGIVDKMKLDEFVDYLDYFNNKWPLQTIWVEKLFWMGMLHQHVISELNIAVAPFADTRANAKILRINFMKKYWRTKTIQVMRDCAIKEQLRIEYLSYNQEDSTASRKDDTLDALSMLVQNLNKDLDMRHLDSSKPKPNKGRKTYRVFQ